MAEEFSAQLQGPNVQPRAPRVPIPASVKFGATGQVTSPCQNREKPGTHSHQLSDPFSMKMRSEFFFDVAVTRSLYTFAHFVPERDKRTAKIS
jgi:hypothetical protein